MTGTVEHSIDSGLEHVPESVHDGVEAAHEGAEAHHGEHPPELTNFFMLLSTSRFNDAEAYPTAYKLIKPFDNLNEPDPMKSVVHTANQNVLVSMISVVLVIVVARMAMSKMALIPGRAQSACELVIDGLRDFFISILGEKHGPRYIPFLLALFIFIWTNNMMGMVPIMKSPSAFFANNIVLGIMVFLYVQYTGIRYLGPKHYLLHLLGNPNDAVTWALSPLMLFLELIGELIKPLSLSLRLFGNIMGEDILLGVFAIMGLGIVALLPMVDNPWIGLPLHLPFMFLSLLLGTIQALIFSLLACVYISLMLPHDEAH